MRRLVAAVSVAAACALLPAAGAQAATVRPSIPRGTILHIDYWTNASHTVQTGYRIIDGCGTGNTHTVGTVTNYSTQYLLPCSGGPV